MRRRARRLGLEPTLPKVVAAKKPIADGSGDGSAEVGVQAHTTNH